MTTRVRHLQPGQLPEPGKPVGSGAGQPAVLAALAAAPTPPAQATDSVQDLQPVHDAVTIDLLNERVAYLERKLQEADSVLEDAARYRWLRRKFCLTGNGDGTCCMHAINLPASIKGWPEPIAAEVMNFCDAAIDAARLEKLKR